MIRKIPSAFAAVVRYLFPSAAVIAARVQIVPHLAFNSESRLRVVNTLKYNFHFFHDFIAFFGI